MPSININKELSIKELIGVVNQLSVKELDKFILELLSIQTKRLNPQLEKIEKNLIKQINKKLSRSKQKKYDLLTQKRLDSEISSKELEQLGILIEEIEEIESKKAQALFTLSQIKGVTPKQLIKRYEIADNA